MEHSNGTRLLYACLDMRKQLNKLLSGGELTQGEYLILRHLRRTGTESPVEQDKRQLRAAALSDLLELSRPSITRILNGLEDRELIVRNIDKDDRRSVAIQMTPKGIAALERANQGILHIADRLAEALGDEDANKLIHLIDRLTDIYRGMSADRVEGKL